MKLALVTAAFLAVAATVACTSPSEGTGARADDQTSDVARMLRRPDGTFDVWCTDGATESAVTVERLLSNEVCGAARTAPAAPTPTSTTAADVVFRGVTRTLARAQFGLDHGVDGDTFHIESHEGGDAKCPDATSASPNRTMIISGVKQVAVGTKLTEADGVTAAFIDFAGDQISDLPFVEATAIMVTVVAINDATGIELEVEATFGTEGTAKGRIAATFCESLSR